MHKFFCRSTGLGGKCVRGVAKIVEPERIGETRCRSSMLPIFEENVSAKWAALLSREHARSGMVAHEPIEVLRKLVQDGFWKGHRPNPGVGLWRPDFKRPVPKLAFLLFDTQVSTERIYVPPFKSEQLASSKPNEASEDHSDAEVIGHRVGSRPDLLNTCCWTFRSALDPTLGNRARIASDQSVFDRGRTYRVEQSVTLRNCVRREFAPQQTVTPTSHRSWRQIAHRKRAEHRKNVQA
jgi:hypothetical protein